MIIEFSVSNFRSIYERVTLSMVAAKLTSKENTQDNIFEVERYKNLPLLKTAAIYGANASGKSNLLKAIDFFEEFLLNSTNLKLGDNITVVPFKLLKIAVNEPSIFEMDFIAHDENRYIYGFSVNESEVIEEHLISFSSSKPTEIFVRKKGEPIKFSSILKGHKKILEEQLQNNHLFLTKAANSNFEQLIPVYQYFKQFNYTEKDGNFLMFSKFNKEVNFRKWLIKLLKTIDSSIENLVMQDLSHELNKTELSIGYRIYVLHKLPGSENEDLIEWEFNEESDGTKKFLNWAYAVYSSLEIGFTFVCDELNNSWHPLITEFIINLFNNKETNPKNAQLIFTTHDSSLLSKDIFRRDQMWFVEKNKQGMSKLFSLADFDKKDVRWDIPFDKWYLSGRFGAIPNIQKFNLNEETVSAK